jgi:phosphoribosylglycinamide formyltransferase-1
MKSIVILISGRGSNMEAIVRAGVPGARVAAVISNRPGATGLGFARERGIATEVVDHTAFADRAGFDAELARRIDAHTPDLVVLAGFMRVLTDGFVSHYAGRLLNIHPSLLPAFPGLDTHARALAAGVRLHGCTVHLVRAGVDDGPILAQAAVPVLPYDTEADLAARVLAQEHRIYPAALAWLAAGRVRVEGNIARIAAAPAEATLANPLPVPPLLPTSGGQG